MKDIPRHLWHDSYIRIGEKKTGGPNLRLLRLDPALPSNTITAYIFNKFAHPSEDRYITPREAARLQQFPDSHSFAGTITNVQLQIGNAVPVGLARAVAALVQQRLRRHAPRRELNAVSLFSGAGGMDLGFKDYFTIVSANEYVPTFAETLRNNFPTTDVINASITDISGRDLARRGHIDVLFGGPPCQPFSAAGKQRGVDDPRGMLVREYLRIAAELRPKYFVLENVPGLVSNAKGGALKFIKQEAASIGYATEHHVLHATDYGVPQLRRRLFVIGRQYPDEPPLGRPFPSHGTPGSQDGFLLRPCATVGSAFAGLSAAQPRIGSRGAGVA
ncbi:DNA (cytosine-5-)-methyltransferase [Ornithinimicrobium cryptoxanthini]